MSKTITPRTSRKGNKTAPVQAPTQAPESQAPIVTQDAPPAEAPKTEAPATQETAPTQAEPAKVGPVAYKRDPRNHALSGARLYAHTVAFLAVTTGMRPNVPMPQFKAVIGGSAYAYHKAKGNIAVGPTGAPILTEKGAQEFATRKGNEPALVDTFARMFREGVLPEGMMFENHPPIKV